MSDQNIKTQVLVIGSGPGGANTALLLARAGADVVMVEEGLHVDPIECPPFSLEEVNTKYRSGGMTLAFGATKVTYVEGKCVGGASEINAGLYHAPLPEVLSEWAESYQIENFGSEKLEPFFRACEMDINVQRMPRGVGPTSLKIKQGASKLKWDAEEVPRCWKYDRDVGDPQVGQRQSMSETLIPKAVELGCRLMSGVKVRRLHWRNQVAHYATASRRDGLGKNQAIKIFFDDVFVCCGAIQTPLLLRRSGIKKNIGDSLRMHPAVRVAARFEEPLNDPREGVPVYQVQEFKPEISLGGSYSSAPHLALWLSGEKDLGRKLQAWKHMALFYTSVRGTGKGSVRNVPLFDEPFVRLPLTEEDIKALVKGLMRLGELLFAMGAKEISPPFEGLGPISEPKDLVLFEDAASEGKMRDISTLHLFSSCPMGEERSRCAVNSYGRLHGFENIYCNDASILSGAPGANPQALIMAIARRNVQHFSSEGHRSGR